MHSLSLATDFNSTIMVFSTTMSAKYAPTYSPRYITGYTTCRSTRIPACISSTTKAPSYTASSNPTPSFACTVNALPSTTSESSL